MPENSIIHFLGQHIGSAAVSAVVSAVVSFIAGKATDKRQRRARQNEAIDQLIEKISEDAVGYWRSSGIDVDSEQRLISDLEKLDERVNLHLPAHVSQSARDDIDRITDWITGGPFQTASRAADRVRASTIKSELRALRKKLC